ncbi:DUF58 domain-containing protein [Planctomycetales bacterium ZRK34]|nr:DUF58 domain-containing protein [Planctomycetales bacterium ZRK34]
MKLFSATWRKVSDPAAWRRGRATLYLSNLWRERFTRTGRYLVIGAIATGIAGSFPDRMVGSYAFSFFTALVLGALTLSAVFRPRLGASRHLPARCVAGSTVNMRIRVTNQGRSPVHDVSGYEFRLPTRVSIEEDPHYKARLDPGESFNFDYTLAVQRRGSYHLPGPTALCAFPFGLTQTTQFHPQGTQLIVYPPFQTLADLDVPAGLRYQPGGMALASHVGESMEFVGTREYQVGDRVRDLHQRSWARVGAPVIKQFEEEFMTRIALLVDTFVPRRAGAAALEANLSLSAAVADYFARREFVIDLFAAGPQLYHFQAGRSLGYLDNILDILACIEKSNDDPLAVVGAAFAEQLRETSAVVLLLLSWDDERAALVDMIQHAEVATKTVVLTDNKKQAAAAKAAGCTHLTMADFKAGVTSL